MANIALLLLVAANLLAWRSGRAEMVKGSWFGRVYRQSNSLKESLRAGQAQIVLEGHYRRFYFYCLEVSPAIFMRSSPQAVEGAGFYPSEFARGCKGPLLVALSLDLPVGVSYVWLESEMGGAHLGSGGKEPGGAFAARLPFRLEQEGSAGRP